MAAFFLTVCFLVALSSVTGYSHPKEVVQKVASHPEWPAFRQMYMTRRAQVKDPGFKNYTCPTIDVDPPKDIHSLAPQYVSVIAAMGDSLTAANGAGAYTIAGVALQYRGLSFSIGGNENLFTTLTLPNIIKYYNPKLFGASHGVTATVNEKRLGELNVGIPGSRARDLLKQAQMLIDRLGQHSQYKDAWKVVTIFIGANDVCGCDKGDPDELVKEWTDQITQALDLLAENLNNTFVNLVNVVRVGQLREYEVYKMCTVTHEVYCKCATHLAKDLNATDALNIKYQKAMYDVPRRYEDRSNFTVVLQPYTEDVIVPLVTVDNVTKPDLAFLAPDCFHFSREGHAAKAAALWNSMMKPIQDKDHFMDPNVVKLDCPTAECPYLRTAVNSEKC